MGDVAQILSGTIVSNVGRLASADDASSMGPNKAIKMVGISKQVMDLIAGGKQDAASAALPPVVPTFSGKLTTGGNEEKEGKEGDEINVKVGSKWISSSKRARPWTWAPFTSSSRTDGAMFHHWVRANVEYTDYPYAKFDIHLDPVAFTDEEYQKYLKSDTWTQGETKRLMELARIFELRWPVIYDRWEEDFEINISSNDAISSSRKIEDLQNRYYGVAATLAQVRIAQEAALEVQNLSAAANAAAQAASSAAATDPSGNASFALQDKADAMLLEAAAARSLATDPGQNQPLIPLVGTGTTNKMFDLEHEKERRHQLDRLWRRSKEEEAEEMQLRKELRVIDAQLRKLKKAGGHLLAAGSSAGSAIGVTGSNIGNSRLSSAASSRNPSRSVSPINIAENTQTLDQSFASTAPVPMPQNPYLQSGRLVPPATGPNGINKSLLTRMDQVLNELGVPARPLPTKRVCDLYDSVRKDILTLVTLQKLTMQKEGVLHARRVKLAKWGSKRISAEDNVLDEEKLLGIAPPTPKPTPVPATATAPKPKVVKKKVVAASGPAGKVKITQKLDSTDGKALPSALKGAGIGKKKVVKRKRPAGPGTKGTPGTAILKPSATAATTDASSGPPMSTAKATSPKGGPALETKGTSDAPSSNTTTSAKKRARKP